MQKINNISKTVQEKRNLLTVRSRRLGLVSGIQKELKLIDERESRLADAMASGSLRIELYDDKIRELNNQRVELENQLSRTKKDNPETALSTLERTKEVFLQAKNAKNDFLNGEDSKRYQMINSLLWNVWFQNKEIQEIQYKKAYSRIANTPKNADFLYCPPCRSRTYDRLLKRELLYQLS